MRKKKRILGDAKACVQPQSTQIQIGCGNGDEGNAWNSLDLAGQPYSEK
jgi:hypothetical protein